MSTFRFGFLALSLCATLNAADIAVMSASQLRVADTNAHLKCQGVVTAVFPGLGGFYLQSAGSSEDELGDGVFVQYAEELHAGVEVQVEGLSQIVHGHPALQAEHVEVLGEAELPVPRMLASSRAGTSQFESACGCLIEVDEPLVVCDSYQYGRYGQLMLAPGARMFNSSNWVMQSTEEVATPRWSIWLDDGSQEENPDPLPHLLPEGLPPRVGDQIHNLRGILDCDNDSYVIHPLPGYRVYRANYRPADPILDGELRIASFNVLNYFTSLGDRGADDPMELERQRAKIVAAIHAMDADIVALIEVENNANAVVEDLVAQLNKGQEADRLYRSVGMPHDGLGSDRIRVALIYRDTFLHQVGESQTSVDNVFSRPPLAATFALAEMPDRKFSVIVNHLKSKGCRGVTPEEEDRGQGCWNPLRVRQARALVELAERVREISGDDDVLLVGDFNACAGEDPVLTIEDAGYEQLLQRLPAYDRYSYVYRGQACALDNAFCTPSLSRQVRGLALWHINADEARILDYNLEYRNPDLYHADPYRSSDHDPVIIGVTLK